MVGTVGGEREGRGEGGGFSDLSSFVAHEYFEGNCGPPNQGKLSFCSHISPHIVLLSVEVRRHGVLTLHKMPKARDMEDKAAQGDELIGERGARESPGESEGVRVEL